MTDFPPVRKLNLFPTFLTRAGNPKPFPSDA